MHVRAVAQAVVGTLANLMRRDSLREESMVGQAHGMMTLVEMVGTQYTHEAGVQREVADIIGRGGYRACRLCTRGAARGGRAGAQATG